MYPQIGYNIGMTNFVTKMYPKNLGVRTRLGHGSWQSRSTSGQDTEKVKCACNLLVTKMYPNRVQF